MIRYEKRFWALAAGLSAMAGFVDAIGFLKLGGFFVSFMSGNSTRLAVGLATDASVAAVAGGLVAAFIAGVMIGSFVRAKAPRCRKAAVLIAVAAFLAAGAAIDTAVGGPWAALVLAIAMGAENAVFQRDGEVSIGLTYMTGTLVKLGQHLASALMGGDRWTWIPYALLWGSLVCGALVGARVQIALGSVAIWVAAIVALLLAAYAAAIGPARQAA